MERVEVTNTFVNLVTMQVCAVEDATDEEILDVCNRLNPSGTTLGWNKVVRREEDHENPTAMPVNCGDFPGRVHFLVLC